MRVEILKYFLKQMFQSDKDIYDRKNGGNMFLIARSKGSKNKWSTLSHNGVKFPPEYIQKNIPLIYDGKEILLEKNAEECAFLYAKYLGSEYVMMNTFNKNFFSDWKRILGNETIIKSFELCDFSQMKKYLDTEKEIHKEEKKQKKTEDDFEMDDDSRYKVCIVDGKIQEVSNYRMEPPAVFIGRGKNPNLGKIKRRIYPEHVTINIGKDDPIPVIQDSLTGHKWGKIVHDRKAEWLCSWKDNITGKTKYLWLSSYSDIKTSGDQKKFDFARKLKKKIKGIKEENDKNLKSDDLKTRQIASALYFIDKMGLRVGGEKGEDSGADTVGVTNLRTEHIKLSENNTISLSFLGKDSVPYENTVQVDPIVYKNIKEFIKDKDKYDQIFDKINSNNVNKYLQSFMKDLTAKVFRTYNASNLFQKELNKISNKYLGQEDKQKEILDEFIKANLKVSKLLNHQKKVSKGFKGMVDKITENLDKLKKSLAKARKSKKKNPQKIDQIKEKIKASKSKKEIVKEMKNMSLETSKANYLDPRCTVSFLKKHKLDIDKIFSKKLQKKFEWSFNVDENYKF
jgi:DNA topoisomerase-1